MVEDGIFSSSIMVQTRFIAVRKNLGGNLEQYKMKNKPLFTSSEWDVPLIDKIWKTIDKIATEKFGFDYYSPQIEIISSEQMLDNYSSVAMPNMYHHWSFGKTFLQNERSYQKGQQGLAYEIVINTNPCLTYLMENNSSSMQALVLCHAAVGHSSFFKTNYLFKNWTDADSILDYLTFAKNYIKSCEDKYGAERVEKLLDACHSLQNHGIDKYKKPSPLKGELERQRKKTWENYFESTFNDLWRTVPKVSTDFGQKDKKISEENILYFLEKHSPILEDWEREVVRIVRKVSQYFYPQRQTQLLNEGFATFTHHLLMTELHEQGYITEGSYLEFLQSHCNVITQLDWDNKYYSGINVYALGFAMLTDIKRMCMNPDAEDLKWFPDICNTDWLATIKNIVANYRDESFILQFLSPKVARQFKLFSIHIKENTGYLEVNATHDDDSFIQIRRSLAEQYDLSRAIPQIEVVHVDWKGNRWLHLEHITKNNQRLDYQDMKKTMLYINKLWGFNVKIVYKDLDGKELEDV
jgi:stage V sporulation protein R